MVRGSNFKSFCMVALLVAEAIQAVTPDIASLASTRLFQIVGTIAERRESPVTHTLHVGCLTTHTEKRPPPNGTVPFEDTSEKSAPDEVCLALASQLTVNEAGNSHKSQHVPFDLDLLFRSRFALGSRRLIACLRPGSVQLCADPLALPHDLLRLPPGPRLALANHSRHTTASIRPWSLWRERPLQAPRVSYGRASARAKTHFQPEAGPLPDMAERKRRYVSSANGTFRFSFAKRQV